MPGHYGDKRKAKKAARKESRAHDKTSRKAYREDHPLGFRIKQGIKNLFQGNKNKKFLEEQNEAPVKRSDLDAEGKALYDKHNK